MVSVPWKLARIHSPWQTQQESVPISVYQAYIPWREDPLPSSFLSCKCSAPWCQGTRQHGGELPDHQTNLSSWTLNNLCLCQLLKMVPFLLRARHGHRALLPFAFPCLLFLGNPWRWPSLFVPLPQICSSPAAAARGGNETQSIVRLSNHLMTLSVEASPVSRLWCWLVVVAPSSLSLALNDSACCASPTVCNLPLTFACSLRLGDLW